MDEKKYSPHSKDMYSENWERFMILWSVTPEFYIGSCIICVFAIISVYFVTRNDNYTECIKSYDHWTKDKKHKTDHRRSEHPLEAINKNSHNSLRNRMHPNTGQTAVLRDELGQINDESNGSAEDDSFEADIMNQPSPYKKSLYRMAAEKLEASLTEEQIREERAIQREQLKAIYDLMRDKNDVFGIKEMSQVEEQMKYYG